MKHSITIRKSFFRRGSIILWPLFLFSFLNGVAQQSNLSSGTGSRIDTVLPFPAAGTNAVVSIYLPAGYAKNNLHYPVVYVPGAGALTDSITHTCIVAGCNDSLVQKGKPGLIVIGYQWLTAGSPDTTAAGIPESQLKLNRDFLLTVLKPFADKQFRTQPAASATLLAGADEGALEAYYCLATRPDVFSRAAIFSPPFLLAPSLATALPDNHPGKFFFCWPVQDVPPEMSNFYFVDHYLGNASNTLVYMAEDENGANNLSSWKAWMPSAINWLMADGFNYVMEK